VAVVYDAAHALGSERGGTPIGRFGAAEVFSLSPTKVVVAGEGGIVTTGDASLAEAIRLGRDYGNPGDYDCRFPGLNARLSELHAAVALASLSELDGHIDRRNELVDRFESSVRHVDGLRVVRPAAGDRSTFKDLTVVVDRERFGLSAVDLQDALAIDGVDSRRYYAPPIHRQAAYDDRWPARRALPLTDALAEAVLSPPLWSHLSDEAIDAVAGTIVALHEHAPSVAEALRARTA
jgi:dTDP-4-amino-4,6-dideoxygalactose transaminase